jgi:maltooligosyltrehalose trehalohydrolase
MEKAEGGWFECTLPGLDLADALYLYELDGTERRPDPASMRQPAGVHGPSCVVDHRAYKWKDGGWNNIPLEDYIIYELHIGTFSTESTFNGAIDLIPYISDLGVTAVEIMPVCAFPGERNWGYDGVFPFSVHEGYGGPEGLKRLVDELHSAGLAAVLDVVYNHLGPEGNYLSRFGPYFTDRYHTFWGNAVNFDGEDSMEVRRFFIENAIHWARDYHIDALRLDAVHGIFDQSPSHILREMNRAVRSRTSAYLIAESDLNDPRIVDAPENGGYGLHSQWNDDFHHSLHTLLTEERSGYYVDFGRTWHMAKALSEGFVYSGQHSAFRGKPHGGSTAHIDPWRFVIFSQNHDQVGNRAAGDRLAAICTPEELRLAASLVVLSPSMPLLFMGEEYAETAPFQYFVDHGDPDLIKAVREGRKSEFPLEETGIEVPDPADEGTFMRSRLDHTLRQGTGEHSRMLEYYKGLVALRKGLPALRGTPRSAVEVLEFEDERSIVMTVTHASQKLIYFISFNREPVGLPLERTSSAAGTGRLGMLLDSSVSKFGTETSSATIKEALDISPMCLRLYETMP